MTRRRQCFTGNERLHRVSDVEASHGSHAGLRLPLGYHEGEAAPGWRDQPWQINAEQMRDDQILASGSRIPSDLFNLRAPLLRCSPEVPLEPTHGFAKYRDAHCSSHMPPASRLISRTSPRLRAARPAAASLDRTFPNDRLLKSLHCHRVRCGSRADARQSSRVPFEPAKIV
jgi:hypothetical protein